MIGWLTVTGNKVTELASKTCLTDLVGCVVCQMRSAIGVKDEHTWSLLTGLEIGDTSGFARYYGDESSATDVQLMGADGSKEILVLGRSNDDGNRWHRWGGQRYQASSS